ncbi:fibronectin type III domain-containing protein [Paracoccus laeviglucosivorans]|uniref:Phage tail protein n=1 Tax=Paracoccus laeviglucosivorans TaxID=1197861 RepID=A0A521CXE5_9RHOB|nr:fibronectin type III domain-containing protein [Paracoccus laeviglucosivorans]SMO64117.1 Putative phage tail protein [Paracoccus laeviglucosivorans]
MRLKFLLAALVLIVLATPADAAPILPLITSIAGMWAGQAVAGALVNAGIIAAGGFAAMAVTVGVATLVGMAVQMLMPPQRMDFPAVNYNPQQPVSYQERVYGIVRKGGVVGVSKFTRVPTTYPGKGRKREYRVYTVILAAHRVKGLLEWYVDNRLVTLNANSFVTEKPYDPVGDVGLRFYRGTQTQAADQMLVDSIPEWTAAHDMAGLAYVVARAKRLEDDNFNEIYPNGKPVIAPVIEGNDLILDPRTNTRGFTRNWALCFAHELVTYQGLQVDWDAVALEADICDQMVATGEGAARPRWRADGVFSTDQTFADIRAQFLIAADGFFYDTADGKVGFNAGRWMQPQITLTPADFISYQITETTDIDAADEYITRYIEPSNDYRETPSGTWKVRDGKARKEVKATLVSSHHQAIALAKRAAAMDHAQYRLTGVLKFIGLRLRGQRFVRFEDPDSGISFFLEVRKLSMGDSWMTWPIEGISTRPEDWLVAAAEFPPRPVYEKLESDSVIDPVDGFSVVAGPSTSGSAMLVSSWAEQDGSYRQRLRYSVAGAEQWQVVDVPKGSTRHEQPGLLDGAAYEWQIRNVRNGKVSPWSATITVTAIADTIGPPALTSFTATGGSEQVELTFGTPNSARFDATRIYRGTSAIFADAIVVRTEYGTPNTIDSWTDTGLAAGTYWYWAEPINASGVAGPRGTPRSVSVT